MPKIDHTLDDPKQLSLAQHNGVSQQKITFTHLKLIWNRSAIHKHECYPSQIWHPDLRKLRWFHFQRFLILQGFCWTPFTSTEHKYIKAGMRALIFFPYSGGDFSDGGQWRQTELEMDGHSSWTQTKKLFKIWAKSNNQLFFLTHTLC